MLTFPIKKAFLIPFISLVFLLFVLTVVVLFSGQTWEKTAISIVFLVALVVAVEASKRRVLASEDGITLLRFFKTKTLTWPEITHLGVMMIRNKAYFLLTTTRGFNIISNLVDRHPELIRLIADKLSPDKVEPEVHQYLEHPVERRSLYVLTWIATVIVTAIIIVKLINI